MRLRFAFMRWLAINLAAVCVGILLSSLAHRMWVLDGFDVWRTYEVMDIAQDLYVDDAYTYRENPQKPLPHPTTQELRGVKYTFIPIRDWQEAKRSVDINVARRDHLVFVVLGEKALGVHSMTPYTPLPRLRLMPLSRAFNMSQERSSNCYRVEDGWAYYFMPD